MEFCELIVPKRDSITIEFEEDQTDDCYHRQNNNYQQNDEEMIDLSICNDRFEEEVNNDLDQANSNINNNDALIEIPPMLAASNSTIINANHIEKDRLLGNVASLANAERNISHHPAIKTKASGDRSGRMDIIENKSGNFNRDIPTTNNPEEVVNIAPSIITNHNETNEFNRKHIMESSVPVVESPVVPRKVINDDTENNQRSPRRSQLRKLSGNSGINEVAAGKEARKLNGIPDDLKDDGNNRSNVSLR